MSINDIMLVAAGAAALLTGSQFALFTCMVFAVHWISRTRRGTGLYAALLISIMTRDPERERDRMDTAGRIYFCADSYRAARHLLGFGNEGKRT